VNPAQFVMADEGGLQKGRTCPDIRMAEIFKTANKH